MKRWNLQDEDFDTVVGEERDRYVEGVRRYDFDASLGLYPDESYKAWKGAVYYITPEILDRLDPIGKKLSPSHTKLIREDTHTKVKDATLPYYATVPQKFNDPGATSAELTKHNNDKSLLLTRWLSKSFDNSK